MGDLRVFESDDEPLAVFDPEALEEAANPIAALLITAANAKAAQDALMRAFADTKSWGYTDALAREVVRKASVYALVDDSDDPLLTSRTIDNLHGFAGTYRGLRARRALGAL